MYSIILLDDILRPRISQHLRESWTEKNWKSGRGEKVGREMKMKRECGGVADKRQIETVHSLAWKVVLHCADLEWRERGMAESKTKDGWSEGLHGSSFLCVISLGSRSQNFQLPRVHAFCFACFVLPFFTLFAQLQIEIPLLSRGRIKRRTIRCIDSE